MVSNPTLYRSIFIGLEIESGEEGTKIDSLEQL